MPFACFFLEGARGPTLKNTFLSKRIKYKPLEKYVMLQRMKSSLKAWYGVVAFMDSNLFF